MQRLSPFQPSLRSLHHQRRRRSGHHRRLGRLQHPGHHRPQWDLCRTGSGKDVMNGRHLLLPEETETFWLCLGRLSPWRGGPSSETPPTTSCLCWRSSWWDETSHDSQDNCCFHHVFIFSLKIALLLLVRSFTMLELIGELTFVPLFSLAVAKMHFVGFAFEWKYSTSAAISWWMLL